MVLPTFVVVVAFFPPQHFPWPSVVKEKSVMADFLQKHTYG